MGGVQALSTWCLPVSVIKVLRAASSPSAEPVSIQPLYPDAIESGGATKLTID